MSAAEDHQKAITDWIMGAKPGHPRSVWSEIAPTSGRFVDAKTLRVEPEALCRKEMPLHSAAVFVRVAKLSANHDEIHQTLHHPCSEGR